MVLAQVSTLNLIGAWVSFAHLSRGIFIKILSNILKI
ncbi:MAG: hypothetical protein ACI83B_001192 [Sediminicola sp.]|jgi:hypothetical protein